MFMPVPMTICVKADIQTTDSGQTANGITEDRWVGANDPASYVVTGRGFRIRVSWGGWSQTPRHPPDVRLCQLHQPDSAADGSPRSFGAGLRFGHGFGGKQHPHSQRWHEHSELVPRLDLLGVVDRAEPDSLRRPQLRARRSRERSLDDHRGGCVRPLPLSRRPCRHHDLDRLCRGQLQQLPARSTATRRTTSRATMRIFCASAAAGRHRPILGRRC